jgi:mRNA interferase MazF
MRNYTFDTNPVIRRGDIYYADLGEMKNSIQGGIRPAIVVSNNQCNKHSPVIHCVPLSKQTGKFRLPTHVMIKGYGLALESIALCEQSQPIHKSKLRGYIGSAPAQMMDDIDRGIKVQFGLSA